MVPAQSGAKRYTGTFAALVGALFLAVIASACVGALSFTPAHALRFLADALHMTTPAPGDTLQRSVFLHLRLPRVLLAGLTGAVLGVAGTIMQGLFRNPIVEPGLAGTSAGAALGAAVVFVFGAGTINGFHSPITALALPAAATIGALAATLLVYRMSSAFGRVNVFTLLLAGIAINAVCNAGTGFLSYIARDPQARNITFWNLGTFTSADWMGVALVAIAFVVCYAFTAVRAKSLNALMLGEDEAAYLGIDTVVFIRNMLVVNTIMVAVATAMTGVIAFVGLVVPHILRMTKTADYRFLVPASALLGAILMEIVDVIARIIIPPAELPIGIITAVIGAPVFLWILMRQRVVAV